MKTYSQQQCWEAWRKEYPNAKITLFDRDRHVLTESGWSSLYSDFVFELRREGIYDYGMGQTNKFEINDCDDYMLHFLSYVRRRHAITHGVTSALALGGMLYNVAGDRTKPHAVTSPLVVIKGALVARALEPQPNGGIFKCTEPERFSCYWLAA